MASVKIPGTGSKTYIDPISDHGAAGNAKTSMAATILAGSLGTLAVGDSSPFVASDVGKVIAIPYAGVIDAGKTVPKTHTTTIATYVNSSTVTLTAPALNAISPATHPAAAGYAFAAWGADDTTPLRDALAAASAARKPIRLGLGKYLTTGELTWPDYCSMIGEGRYDSVLYPVGAGFSCIRYAGGSAGQPPVLACTLRDFEIDGHGLANSTYGTGTKGIYLVHFREALFENMYVHHTPATAFGCDHPIDSEWRNCWADYGGRQVDELGGSAGGSGMGIGSGKNEWENLLVSGGGASHCGKYGLFIENQMTSDPLPKGYRVDSFVADSNKYGLSENGAQGAIFNACQAFRNTVAGFQVYKAFTARYGRDTLFAACVAMYNGVGLNIDSGDGQAKWDGGEIAFNTSNGIELQDTSAGANSAPHPTNLRVRNADVFQNAGRGLKTVGGSFGRLSIEGGHWFNNGSSGTPRPAIEISRPVDRLKVTRVEAWDDRTPQGQSYGLETTGATITELVYGGCDFRGNLTAKDLIPGGTVTTQTPILGGNL